jgi:hypothetical protein
MGRATMGPFFWSSCGILLPIRARILSLHGVVFDIFVLDPSGGAAPLPGLGAVTPATGADPAAASPFAAAKIPFGNPALTMISVWLGA